MPTAASSEINGAQAIVRMLESYGVKHVFGVPGETPSLPFTRRCTSDATRSPTCSPATSARPASWRTSTPGSPTSPGVRVPVRGRERSTPRPGSPKPTPPRFPFCS